MTEQHLRHIRTHLLLPSTPLAPAHPPEDVYLGGRREGALHELVCLRVAGMSPLLAVFRFCGKRSSEGLYARESLASRLEGSPPPAGAAPPLVAEIPRAGEAIPDFLARLRSGGVAARLTVHRKHVLLAADFRPDNPSPFEPAKLRAGPLRLHAFRTADGHVLTGRTCDVSDDRRFVGIARAVQHTPAGTVRLPNLIVNRSWIAVAVDLADDTNRLAVAASLPFMAAQANPASVLGVDADGGRAMAGARGVPPLARGVWRGAEA